MHTPHCVGQTVLERRVGQTPTIATAGDVDALKAQLSAHVARLDPVVTACNAPDLLSLWQPFKAATLTYTSLSSVGQAMPFPIGPGIDFPTQYAQGQALSAALDGWDQTLAQKCGLAPAPPAPQPPPFIGPGGTVDTSGAGTAVSTVAVAGAVGLAAIAAIAIFRK